MADLDRLKSDWESLAERDALWAILTDASKADGRWDPAEFMATGDLEIETVMAHLEKIGCTPEWRGAALDFGCGVGRLTQALAERFATCVGIDISQQMIQKAQALNRHAHCRYVASSTGQLPFDDNSFAFLYSNIVLQHVPRQLAEGYLREFVRVLAPGGVLVFGVQDHFATGDVASWVTLARLRLRPRSRIKQILGRGGGNMQMHCLPENLVRRVLESASGSARVVDMQITNTGRKDFNGELVYLHNPPASGFVGKQYCVLKEA